MSLTESVAALVEEFGAATVDDLMPDMDGYTRTQVIKALQWAKHTGRISCDGYGPRRKGAVGKQTCLPTTYRAIPKAAAPGPRVASVWDLGASACQA